MLHKSWQNFCSAGTISYTFVHTQPLHRERFGRFEKFEFGHSLRFSPLGKIKFLGPKIVIYKDSKAQKSCLQLQSYLVDYNQRLKTFGIQPHVKTSILFWEIFGQQRSTNCFLVLPKLLMRIVWEVLVDLGLRLATVLPLTQCLTGRPGRLEKFCQCLWSAEKGDVIKLSPINIVTLNFSVLLS